MRWEKLKPITRLTQDSAQEMGEVSGPGKRWGHTCNAISGGKLLYVFGGYGKNNSQTNQVHVFDTDKRTWTEPVIKGTPPSPRDSHSCTTVGDNLFVFGGTDGMNPLKDLHILDTSSHTWISPTVGGERPEAREGHSAALIGKQLFIFGGCGKSSETSNEVYYNDLYLLNTETFVWNHVSTSGSPPSARDSHTCSSWKNNIIVIGGEDESGSYLSDVYILNTETFNWKVLDTSGQLPPRAGHSTVAFGKNLFVFGGFTDDQNLYDDLHMLNVEIAVWTKVLAGGAELTARFSVAGDSLGPHKDGVLVFIGGCNMYLEPLDDMLYLYTGLASENGIGEQEGTQRVERISLKKQLRLKTQRRQHSSSLHNTNLPIIGTNANSFQPIPVSNVGQSSSANVPLDGSQHPEGKRTFHAKITNTVPGGYTIETMIDGKLLRGVVFSNKQPSSTTVNENSTRKRATKAALGGRGKAPASHESQTDIVAASILENLAPFDASHPQEQVSKIPIPPVAPSVNLGDDVMMYDAPISCTPISCIEVSKENTTATAKDSAIFVSNQGGTEPTTNG